MNNIQHILFGTLVAFVFAPLSAFAALNVTFESSPLFTVSNFVPGDTISKTVTVENTGDAAEDVYTQLINYIDPDGLGDHLNLRILDGSTEMFAGTFSSFEGSGQVPLATLATGASDVYTFEVEFLASAGDDYQEKSLGFDLCVGFSGGQLNCGDSNNGNGGGGNGGGGSGGGGGGGSSGGGGGGGGTTDITSLTIFNEQVLSITVGPIDVQEGTATIFWNTNRPATSRVVYGLESGGPYSLNLSDPNFGYPLSNTEDLGLVEDHTMVLTDLIPGETYVVRVMSRESSSGLPTVSFEFPFVLAFVADDTPPETPPGPSGPSTPPEEPSGIVAGERTDDISPQEGLIAGAFSALPGILFDFARSWQECVALSLFVLVVIYLLWALIARLLRWDEGDPVEYARKRMLTFVVLLIAAIVLAFYFVYYCIIPPLAVALIIAVVWLGVLIVRGGGDTGIEESNEQP